MIPEVRCKKCKKKLAEKLEGNIQIVCPRCGTYNAFSETLDNKEKI